MQRSESDPLCVKVKRCVVIIPSYNSGAKLIETVVRACDQWASVWVVLDGSTDGSESSLADLHMERRGLRVIVRACNGGKGAAVLDALRLAELEGYEYGLVLDADGQHPVEKIPEFFHLALQRTHSLILGVPIFGPEAPLLRIYGRLFGNTFAEIETLGGGIRDSLFGFRVYPVQLSLRIMEAITSGRGFDFDTVLAVRLLWAGAHPVNVPVPVVYFPKDRGGVSHFRYMKDNWLLIRRHVALLAEMIPRFPRLLLWRFGTMRGHICP